VCVYIFHQCWFWGAPVVPATEEAELGVSLEPRNLKPEWQYNETPFKKKKKKNNFSRVGSTQDTCHEHKWLNTNANSTQDSHFQIVNGSITEAWDSVPNEYALKETRGRETGRHLANKSSRGILGLSAGSTWTTEPSVQ
jgi:hypothetical protein